MLAPLLTACGTWFYLTPVVYPLSQVPERFHAWFAQSRGLLGFVAAVVLPMPVPAGVPWAGCMGSGTGWWGLVVFRSMKSALGEAL